MQMLRSKTATYNIYIYTVVCYFPRWFKWLLTWKKNCLCCFFRIKLLMEFISFFFWKEKSWIHFLMKNNFLRWVVHSPSLKMEYFFPSNKILLIFTKEQNYTIFHVKKIYWSMMNYQNSSDILQGRAKSSK